MSNPNPSRPPEVLEKVFQREGDEYPDVPLAEKAIQIVLYKPVDEAIRAMPRAEKVAWLRRVLTDAALQELRVEL